MTGKVSGICIDSRDASSGALFVPLAGERHDGHDFIGQAYSLGARTFLIGKHRHNDVPSLEASLGEAFFLCVDDTLAALQEMAQNHVSRNMHIPRIGITGSSGKTTTKECIKAILSRCGQVVCNEGNLNSEIGLPLSVMAMSELDDYAVFEMGMNREGEMDILADILKPDYAIITNVGTAHVGILGSRDAIAAEKRKALAYINKAERAVLWESDDYLSFLSAGLDGSPSLFGRGSMKSVGNIRPVGLEGSILSYKDIEIRLPLPGPYNALNALGAIRLCELLDVSPGVMKEGLESTSPLFGRGQVHKGKVTVLSDCYNANPESMKASIDFFASLEVDGIRHYVLASMKELGRETDKMHAELGEFIGSLVKSDPVYLFGAEMKEAFKVLRNRSNIFWTDDYAVLQQRLINSLGIGDQVLLKGSRSMELERLIEAMESGLSRMEVC